MSDDKTTPSNRFKKNLLTLFTIVEDMYEEGINNGVVEEEKINIILPAIKIYISTKNSDTMINRWIKKTYEHWHKIKEKDIGYFQDIGLRIFNIIQDKGLDRLKEEDEDYQGDGFMKQVSDGQVSGFKKLLQGEYEYDGDKYKIFNEETESLIWEIMHSFVKISICYIHETRRIIEGEPTVDCFMNIDVQEMATEWGVRSI